MQTLGRLFFPAPSCPAALNMQRLLFRTRATAWEKTASETLATDAKADKRIWVSVDGGANVRPCRVDVGAYRV